MLVRKSSHKVPHSLLACSFYSHYMFTFAYIHPPVYSAIGVILSAISFLFYAFVILFMRNCACLFYPCLVSYILSLAFSHFNRYSQFTIFINTASSCWQSLAAVNSLIAVLLDCAWELPSTFYNIIQFYINFSVHTGCFYHIIIKTRIKAHCCSHTMGSSPYLLD